MTNMNTYRQRVQAIINKDYDHEIPEKLRSVDFNRIIKSMLKKLFSDCEIHSLKGTYCYASGFISKSGKYIYYNFQDYRYRNWDEQILFRTAENEKDFHGGTNHYTDLDNMEEDIRYLLER